MLVRAEPGRRRLDRGARGRPDEVLDVSGMGAKPDVQQAVPAGDAADHMMTLAQGRCTPIKAAEIGGSAGKEATFAEHGDALPK